MDNHRAREIAEKMLGDYALAMSGWTFKFDNALSRFGYCHYSTKTISLSHRLVELNDEARVVRTILHEIAHALSRPRAGHGWEWRRIALKIGCDGKRCYSTTDTMTPAARFKGTCPTCGREITRNARKTGLACGPCIKKGGGVYDAAHRFVWTRNRGGL